MQALPFLNVVASLRQSFSVNTNVSNTYFTLIKTHLNTLSKRVVKVLMATGHTLSSFVAPDALLTIIFKF